MKIHSSSTPWKPKDETVFDYANRGLRHTDDQRGQLEEIENTLINCREAFARLLETLAQKGALTAPEVTKIVKGYEDRGAKFITQDDS